MKEYYNDITRENLELIRLHREKLQDINSTIDGNQKAVDEIRIQNENLKKPLAKAIDELDTLRRQMASFAKDEMALSNANARLVVLKKQVIEMKREKVALEEKYKRMEREKEDMYKKFEVAIEQLQSKSEYKNKVLDDKLSQLQEEFDRKDAQLNEIVQRSGLDGKSVEEICKKMEDAIEAKNSLLRNLRYSLAHATKAYNDAIRVYEAKLIEFGIPAEELGLELLETNTSTMPAGLVAA